VAEGIQDKDGRLIFQTVDPAQADQLQRPLTGGVAQFLAENVARHLKKRCRSEKPGLLGRASPMHLAKRDLLDADAAGRYAVRSLLAGETEKMVSLLPLREVAGPSECSLVAIREVAGVERPIPAAWIRDGAIPVTDEFFNYVNPLIGELAPCYGPLAEERNLVGKF
jgi:6-phosphofructokinase 1